MSVGSDRVMLDAVYEMHDARTPEELREAALSGLRRTVGTELATWNRVDPTTRAASVHCEPVPLPSEFHLLGEQIGEVPFVRTLTSGPALDPLTLSEDWSKSQRDRSPVYQDVIRAARCDHQIQVVVEYDAAGRWEAIAGSRASRDFGAAEKVVLAELVRHLRQAHARLRERAGEVAQAGLRAGLTQRQAEALQAVADGATMRSAAARLGVTPKTLENYLQAAYRRLGVNGRLAALNAVSGR